MQWKSHLFDEINLGDSAEYQRKLNTGDIELAAIIGGSIKAGGVKQARANSCRIMFSILIGSRLPGPGSIIINENLQANSEVLLNLGDCLIANAKVSEKLDGRKLRIDVTCVNQYGDLLSSGYFLVICPEHRQSIEKSGGVNIVLRRYSAFERIYDLCRDKPPIRTAIVHPCDIESLRAPLEASRNGMIIPFLIGPERKIREVAAAAGLSLDGISIVSTEHSHAAAEKAVEMARSGEVKALMKGSLHTDELMAAIVPSSTGLRTERRISHVYLMDVPSYPKLLLITDAAVNIDPDLETKRDICQNAIDLALVLGINHPKVAILAAVENVNPKMQHTIDAAALCKMAERGQIVGGMLDGPLAFDNAISVEAARIKNIHSTVAGHADILLAPDLESANMLSKQLIYLAAADTAGILLGTKVPVVLTSRADTTRTREASIAVMMLLAHTL